MKFPIYTELSVVQKRMLDLADQAKERAYNPYSRFFVGACLVTKNGVYITGANVENAAYGSTICAERSALVKANAEGERSFRGIAIIARGETFSTKEVTSPCGSCRQMLFESSQVSECDLEVIMATTQKDKIVIATMGELLPLGFGPKNMSLDLKQFQQ